MRNRYSAGECGSPSYGFTVIELMLTIAVVAVVAGLAVPRFHNFLERNQLAIAINDFSSALSIARSEAIKRKQTIVVCPRGIDDSCEGHAYENGFIVKVADTEEMIWMNRGLPSGYTLRGNGGITNHVGYRHDGRPTAFGSITLCKDAQVSMGRKLIINRTGRVRLDQEPDHCAIAGG